MSEIDVFNNNKLPELTHRQRKIVLGCLFGKGCIVKPPGNRNCYMCIRQSKREDINILAYKAAELKDFGRTKAVIEDKNSIKWYSATHSVWNEFYKLCYKNNKKRLSEEWLDGLSSSSFAMMFLDLARERKDFCLGLNISSFLKQKKLLLKYFEEVDLKCNIEKTRLVFDRTTTDKFLKIIYQDVPEYLVYRIQQYIP